MTPNNVKPLHQIINNANRYAEESNKNKYLTLIISDSKIMLKTMRKYRAKSKILCLKRILELQALLSLMVTNTIYKFS